MNKDFDKVVFTSQNVINGKEITIVYHDLDDDWQFFSADNKNITEEDVKIAGFGEIIETDASLKDLISHLPKGFMAQRKNKGESWEIKSDQIE